MSEDGQTMGDMLDQLETVGQDDGEASLGDLVEAFGNRGHGPILMIPALLVLTPLGGIPLFPSVMAMVIILFSAQMLIGKNQISLPGFLGKRGVSSYRLTSAVGKARPAARRLDRWFHGRLPTLTRNSFVRGSAAVCVLLAASVPPLEVVPFSAAVPMAAIAIFGHALTVKDGVLMIAAFTVSAFAIGLALTML